MKRNKILVKMNIYDLIPRAFSFFLLLRDCAENGNGNSALSLSIKKKGLRERLENSKRNFDIIFRTFLK